MTQSNQYEDSDLKVVMADVVEKSSILHKLYVGVYNFLLRHHQDWMHYYCSLIEFVKPDNNEFGYRLAARYANELLSSVDPLVVVSVHPMANYYLARSLKKLKLKYHPKLIIVVTDPNAKLWSGWACNDADIIVAPNDSVRQSLIKLGVTPSKIKTIGMPVNPEFLQAPLHDKKRFLNSLGFNPSIITICLSAGDAGGGNVAQIYEALSAVRRPIQVIVICGNNKELTDKIVEQSGRTKIPTVVLQKIRSMSEAMSACDLLVTKAGGLTTYEAVARRLPMAIDLITAPMPQEAGTANMLIEVGLAKPVKYARDIVEIVQTLNPKNRCEFQLPKKYNFDRINSVNEIAELILHSCDIIPQKIGNELLVKSVN